MGRVSSKTGRVPTRLVFLAEVSGPLIKFARAVSVAKSLLSMHFVHLFAVSWGFLRNKQMKIAFEIRLGRHLFEIIPRLFF